MTPTSRLIRFGILAFLVAISPAFSAPPGSTLRGGRVGWARLITSNSYWGIHSDQDPKLADFIRSQTTLNIDPTWYSVDPQNLETLCAYPFVYVKDLSHVTAPHALENLREYVERGGFICIDPCIANYSESRFLAHQTELLQRMMPGCEIRALSDDHDLFRCYFKITVEDLFTSDMLARGASRPASIGMRGVFKGDRMFAVISVSGLECGWPQTPKRTPGCMKMIVNAYVYAMTR